MIKFTNGLNEATIRNLSKIKKEPRWMLELRLRAYQNFLDMPMPNFGPNLSDLDFNKICYYHNPAEKVADRWQDIPSSIKETYDRIGLPEAEQRYLGGVGAQYDSGVVYQRLRQEWLDKGVVFLDTDTALQKHPDLFKQYFASVVPINDNKFTALNSAVWSGGSFIYVPPGVKLDIPLQAYFRINLANIGQFERTLIIVDEDAEVQYIEGCTAPIYSTDCLHSAVVEVIAKPRSRVRYTTIQNWSTNVLNLTTQRMLIRKDAFGEWIDGNIGSKITMKYPAIVLSEEGARGEILSLAMANAGQNQDNGGKAIHLAPHTTSSIVSKSISKNGGVSNYRGKVYVSPSAHNCQVSTRCDALLMDEISASNTYPNNNLGSNDTIVSHEATVSEINKQQLFYLQSRGIDENEATGLLVNGFVEPIIRELPMEYAVELNRLIDLSMEDSIG